MARDSGFYGLWVFYFWSKGKFEISVFEDGNVSGKHFCKSLKPAKKNNSAIEMQFRVLDDTHAVGLCQACGSRIVFQYSPNMHPREILNGLRELEQKSYPEGGKKF